MSAAARKMTVQARPPSFKNQMYIREGIATTLANVRMVGNVRMVDFPPEGLFAATSALTMGLCDLVLGKAVGCRERWNALLERLWKHCVLLKDLGCEMVKDGLMTLFVSLKGPMRLFL